MQEYDCYYAFTSQIMIIIIRKPIYSNSTEYSNIEWYKLLILYIYNDTYGIMQSHDSLQLEHSFEMKTILPLDSITIFNKQGLGIMGLYLGIDPVEYLLMDHLLTNGCLLMIIMLYNLHQYSIMNLFE